MKFSFLQSDPTIKVAVDLLGARLHRRTTSGKILSGRIVETEAYLGLKDPACHSYHAKRTSRVEPFYKPAGTSYIYLIYGVHHCFNVITGDPDTPEAVLIRALEPLEGVEDMKENRGKTKILDLCSGPGKLAQALDLDLRLNGHDLRKEPLWIEPPASPPKEKITVGARIGLAAHKPSSYWPLRFYFADNPYVSPPRAGASDASDNPDLKIWLAESLKTRSWQLL